VKIEISDEVKDGVVIASLMQDYVKCYHETDEDGDPYNDEEMMGALKIVLEYYLTPIELKEFFGALK